MFFTMRASVPTWRSRRPRIPACPIRFGEHTLTADVVRAGDELHVFHNGRHRVLALSDIIAQSSAAEVDTGRLTAPMPGKLIAIHAAAGARVERGAPLLVMEAMKMEHTIVALERRRQRNPVCRRRSGCRGCRTGPLFGSCRIGLRVRSQHRGHQRCWRQLLDRILQRGDDIGGTRGQKTFAPFLSLAIGMPQRHHDLQLREARTKPFAQEGCVQNRARRKRRYVHGLRHGLGDVFEDFPFSTSVVNSSAVTRRALSRRSSIAPTISSASSCAGTMHTITGPCAASTLGVAAPPTTRWLLRFVWALGQVIDKAAHVVVQKTRALLRQRVVMAIAFRHSEHRINTAS